MALISLQAVSLPKRLDTVGFTVAAGEFFAILGPNGSGKSSLLQCLAGLLPHTGSCTLGGQEIRKLESRQRARSIAYLPQACDSAWPLSVEDIVALGRLPWGDNNLAARENALEAAGVVTLRQRRIDALSGGEKARVWLARLLAGCPQVLLADEPIASLDLYYQRSVMQALRHYARDGKSVLIALHDFSLAARFCDRLCLMDKGRVHACGTPAEVLTEAHLSTVFQVPVHVDLAALPPVILAK